MENKREGEVGDIWHGIFGENYAESLTKLIHACIHNEKISYKYYNKYAYLADNTNTLPIQAVLRKIKDKNLEFLSIFPKFPLEFKNMFFEAESVDEWANGAEAVFTGRLYGQRDISLFCQNYLDYKETDLVGKKVNINISVVGLWAETLPEKERTFVLEEGPFKGKTVSWNSLRYLNPIEKGKPEISEFFFPIQGIEKINFMGSELYKIKGLMTDIEDKDGDYYYSVYMNKELIKNPDTLKIEEPFCGQGIVMGEIVEILKE